MLKVFILAAALCGQAPQPQLWQLADSHGTVWQHADPAYLSRWVAERNVRMVRPIVPTEPVYRPPLNYYQLLWGSSPCAGGNCPR